MSTTKERIKEFLTQMASQDNRSTADPFYYVIRSEISRPAPLDCCSYTEFYDPDDPEDTYSSTEEFVNKQIENGHSKEEAKKMVHDLEEIGYVKDWEKKGMFLTETDAKEHLRRNHYHYSQNAHTYVEHAWRAPELEQFLKDLFDYFEVEKRWG